MECISTKLSNLFGCTGCLFPIAGFIFLAFSIFKGAGWKGGITGVLLIVVSIAFLAKAQKLEEARLAEQRDILRSLELPKGNLGRTRTCISSDALTRVTMHEDLHQLFCWRAVDDLGKPVPQAKVNMNYAIDCYEFTDLEAVATVENSDVTNMSYASTNIPLLEYIKLEIMSKLPKTIKANRVHTLALVMQFSDAADSFYQVNFIKDKYMDMGISSPEYEKLASELKLWNSTLTNVLNNRPFQDVEKSVSQRERNAVQSVDGQLPPSFSRPQDNGAKVLGRIDVSGQSNEHEVIEPIQSSTKSETFKGIEAASNVESASSDTEATASEPKELSYFEKLVAENKRQMDSKGPSEKK